MPGARQAKVCRTPSGGANLTTPPGIIGCFFACGGELETWRRALSFSPGFNRVNWSSFELFNRFNGFQLLHLAAYARKPLKRLKKLYFLSLINRLKPCGN